MDGRRHGRKTARWWALALVAALFPFGFAAMQATAGTPVRRWAWRIAIAMAAGGTEWAIWATLDPRRAPEHGPEFMLAQAAMLCIGIQMLQGPLLAWWARGSVLARFAALPATIAVAWLAAQPMLRAGAELRRQADAANVSAQAEDTTDGIATPGRRVVREMERLMAMGYDHPKAVESETGRMALRVVADDCDGGDGQACKTRDALLGDTAQGVMRRPWALIAWLAGSARGQPGG